MNVNNNKKNTYAQKSSPSSDYSKLLDAKKITLTPTPTPTPTPTETALQVRLIPEETAIPSDRPVPQNRIERFSRDIDSIPDTPFSLCVIL
jgi:hypothetical protein